MSPEYIAGVLDADGSFSILRKRRPGLANGHDYRAAVQLSWIETPRTLAVLEHLRDRYGGRIAREERATNTIIRWHIWSRKTEPLLRDVLPHLQLKREQAECLLQHLELVHPGNRRPCPPEVWAERARLSERVRTLNAEGKR